MFILWRERNVTKKSISGTFKMEENIDPLENVQFDIE